MSESPVPIMSAEEITASFAEVAAVIADLAFLTGQSALLAAMQRAPVADRSPFGVMLAAALAAAATDERKVRLARMKPEGHGD